MSKKGQQTLKWQDNYSDFLLKCYGKNKNEVLISKNKTKDTMSIKENVPMRMAEEKVLIH